MPDTPAPIVPSLTDIQGSISREQALQPHLTDQIKTSWWKKVTHGSEHMSLTQRLFFIQNLSVMVKAGLPLASALSTIGKQMTNKNVQRVVTVLHDDVEHGKTLTDAMERFPKIFNSMFISMIKIGEVSGRLEEILDQLYIQLKKDHELISKVRGAMIYPIVVLTAMCGIGAFMMAFVVPKLIPQFKELGAKMPLPTQILINISDFLTHNGILAAVLVFGGLSALIWLLKHPLKRPWHALMLRLPVFGKVVKKVNLGRFTRTLSSLLKTEVPIVQTMRITGQTLGNQLYREALEETADQLKQGVTIHEMLAKKPHLFPPLITQMVAVGEETGSLDTVLSEIADFYEQDIDQTMKDLPTLIEPILMVIMGAGVGGMAVAMLLPMYSLSDAIK